MVLPGRRRSSCAASAAGTFQGLGGAKKAGPTRVPSGVTGRRGRGAKVIRDGNKRVRRDVLSLRETTHDLLVIGGGIHGAAVAWDAALRGLKVALVEAEDFGGQTSWNSLKTIHGGFRYLQTGDLRRLRTSV